MNIHKIYKLLSALLLMILIPACRVPTAIPTSAQTPIASESIAGIIAKYRQEIQQRMPQEKIPGLAIAVVDDQDILWLEGYGYTDWDKKIPVTPSTLFSIQSMSKSFTATAAMFAAQEGLVDLDAPITTYLPDFRVHSIFEEHPERKMTLRMLLSHTAGFAHEAPYGSNNDHPAYSFEKHVASISDTWLKFPVGTRYDYSNLGIDLAGYILQVRAGMPFTRYVQEKVLGPLGMTGSTLEVSRVRNTTTRAIGHVEGPIRPPVDFLLIPSGGVWTTAQNMARYLQFHIQKGAIDGKRLLREDLAETMYTPPNAPAYHYAQGVIVTTRHGARRFEHGGGGFGFTSYMIWYPELKLGAVVLTNAEDHDLQYELCEQVLDSLIDSASALYAQRAEGAVQGAPAYPPSQGGIVLSDDGLRALIAGKALPADAAARERRKAYTGMYIVTTWGVPSFKVEVIDLNGQLLYATPFETGSLVEVEPGLFFSPRGDTFDTRGPFPTGLNIRLVKADPQALPFQIAFYAACALIFLSTLFFRPARALFRRIRRKSKRVEAAAVHPPRSPWSAWAGGLAALASLFSLLCLAIVALVPNLVYVPWPRPYADLSWWQFAPLSLPFASLLAAAGVALLILLSMRNRSGATATRFYYFLVALALLAFNGVILT